MLPLTLRLGWATLHGSNLMDTPYTPPDGLAALDRPRLRRRAVHPAQPRALPRGRLRTTAETDPAVAR